MRCPELQKRWLAARVGGAADPAAVRHVEGCSTCQAFVAAQAQVDAWLALDVAEPPGVGFDTRFFARLEDAKRAPATAARGTWWRWAVLATAATAAALVGVVVGRGDPHAMAPQEIALAMNLDLLQEDVNMLRQLDDVEAYALLDKLPPGPLVPESGPRP